MPVLKIYFDDSLKDSINLLRDDIVAGLESMMKDRLLADPANCQIIMIPVVHSSPHPVYVDMQFRANEHRTPAVVETAMSDIAATLSGALCSGIRIRAFDIDQAGLHAFDVD